MKISCAIAIIALVLQGLLLHTDARLGSLDLDGEDYPAPASTSYFRDDSEFGFEENFIDNEEASDFVLESDVGTAEEAGSIWSVSSSIIWIKFTRKTMQAAISYCLWP